jgi:uncharacterized repeat protein (TIGR02543 family)
MNAQKACCQFATGRLGCAATAGYKLAARSWSGLVLALAVYSHAQDSQFTFDPNGNLLRQIPAIVAPPQILSQPEPQIVGPGELASFFVVVADTRTLTYQWRFNSASISGATNETLLLRNVNAANEGQYSVVLVNPSGSVTSAPAALMVDSDGDGLSDSWELANFGNLNQKASVDFDGDGVSNANEFRDGTSPTNSASALFRLTALADGGTISVAPDQFTYTNGQIVTVTVTELPGDHFQGWTGDAIGTNNPLTLLMTNNQSVFAHFRAYEIIWTNLAGGNWHEPLNWSPNLVPNADDTVWITNTVSVTVSGDAHCGNFTFGSPAAPTLTGSGALTIHGSATWAQGLMSGTGWTIIAPGGRLTLTYALGLTLSARTLENGGTIVLSGAGGLALNGSVLTNRPGGLVQIQNAVPLSFGGGAARFDNAGTFRRVGSGTTRVTVPLNNYGAVELQEGTLSVSGGGLNSGTIEAAGGTALVLAGSSLSVTFTASAASSITGAGSLTVSGGTANLGGLVNLGGTHTFSAFANLTGNYICTNNTLNVAGGSANFTGTGLITPATVTLSSGALSGSSVVTVLSQMTWTGGAMNGSGGARTIIPSGATLSISSPTGVSMTARTLDNEGTVLWSGAGNINLNGAVITNRLDGLFQAQNNARFGFSGGVNRFDNAGTFRKTSSGTTTFFSGVSLNNYGTVEIRRGILQASGGYTSSSAALLNSALGGTTAGAGFGKLQVAGTVNLNGSLSVDLINGFLPATNDSFAVLTASTRNGSFANFYYPSNDVAMQLSNTSTSVIARVTGLVMNVAQPTLLSPEIAGPEVRLTWTAISNTTYRLEFKSDLRTTNWNALPGDITASSNTVSSLDALTTSNRFYRVRVVQ